MAKSRKKNDHYSGIGGQAVIEGVMMRNKNRYAVAVRTPDNDVNVAVEEYVPFGPDNAIAKLPFIRGVFAFIDSMILAVKTLNYSAAFYEEEDLRQKRRQKKRLFDRILGDKAESVLSTITVVFSLVFAIALFMLLPYFIASLLKQFIVSDTVIAIAEGVIRIVIFILYLLLISLMNDIKRTFMYHGAEHKCINCIETGNALTLENVMKASRQHKRCGTSFMFLVVFVSIILFMFIRVDEPALRVVIRILLIPVISGISYEIIRLAGRSDNIFVRIISAPGLFLQKLTTKEPDESMAE
nr:DUF1385 domain-containing protein [Lachnospiraceae bacterium]